MKLECENCPHVVDTDLGGFEYVQNADKLMIACPECGAPIEVPCEEDEDESDDESADDEA